MRRPKTSHSRRKIFSLPAKSVLILVLAFGCGGRAEGAEVLRIDSFESGDIAIFQAGFIAGETAAVRLVPTLSGVHDLQEVHFLLGGSTSVVTVTLNIWVDTGADAPGSLLYTGDYQITGSASAFQSIDLSAENIQVDGAFRVGLTFQHAGYPGPARDDDGIKSALNFIDADGLGWVKSSLLGLTGDWIIRATVNPAAGFSVGGTVAGLSGSVILSNNIADFLVINVDGPYTFAAALADGATYSVQVDSEPAGQDCIVAGAAGTVAGANVADVTVICVAESTVRSNDGWHGGLNAGYQAGFVAGEIAAVRLDPGGPGTNRITGLHFMFGGDVSSQSVQLIIWDDAAGTDVPGSQLFSQTVQLGGQLALQGVDLSSYDIQVTGPYRVGLSFTHAGFPSVARDDDGSIISSRNYIFSGGNWTQSTVFGLTGDWIIRAVDEEVVTGQSLAITAVSDLPNDQGKQVRLSWDAATQDSPGSVPPVTGYAIFRRIDSALKMAHFSPGDPALAYPPGDWDYLLTVPAFQEAVYATIVPTVADSTISGGLYESVFFVRAMTASPGTFFDSLPDSGYSVDNLAPAVPQNLLVVFQAGVGNDLSWDASEDADFQYYKIYRGASPEFMIDPLAAVHTTAAPVWQDLGGTQASYYRISGVDYSGNEGLATLALGVSGVDGQVPNRPALAQNFPNPFNPSTRINFSLALAGQVRLGVFDSRGLLLRTLVAAGLPAGDHAVVWDGTDQQGLRAGSGVYYYRLEIAGERALTRPMMLIK